jgi:multiple sugar transport system permease protein
MSEIKAKRAIPRRRSLDRNSPASVITGTAFMVAFAIYFLTPLWWLFVSSTKSRTDMAATFGLWFSGDFQLVENLQTLFARDDQAFGKWLLNSFLYAGLGGLLGTLLAVMMGYALARYEFKAREPIFAGVLAGILMPVTALALPLFLMFGAINMTDTFWAVFLPSLISPFGVYLARIYAGAAVPEELLEAARLDGSGEFRTFFTMSLRLMAPAVVTIFLFQFTQIWNNFFLPLIMLQDNSLFPVSLGLYVWNSQNLFDSSLQLLVVVGAMVAIFPVIVAFLLLQRFWRTGLAEGSVK